MVFDINRIKDIVPTVDTYNKLDFNEIKPESTTDYENTLLKYRHLYDTLMVEYYDKEEFEKSKIFWLFSAASSFCLQNPNHPHRPFTPLMATRTSRTAIPEDFSDAELMFFSEILQTINNHFLAARISDILWVVVKPKKVEHALLAIDMYIKYPLTGIKFHAEGSESAWLRAKYLATILKNRGKEKLRYIKHTLYHTLIELDGQNESNGIGLSKLLTEIKSLLTPEEKINIADKFENLSTIQPNSFLKKIYYDEAIKWCSFSGNENKIPYLISNFVEGIESEISESLSKDEINVISINNNLEMAIIYLQKIQNNDDDKLDINNRLQKLRELKTKYDREALSQMEGVSSGPIDFTEAINDSINRIKGKSIMDALRELIYIYPPINVDNIKEESKKSIKEYPLRYLFVNTYLDSSGHKITSIPPPDFSDLDSEQSKPAVLAEMINKYISKINFAVCGRILPALETFNLEHHITETDLLMIVRNSSIVVPEREEIWAKALYYGFELDLIISTQLLAPQYEHLIRNILQTKGILTTHIDDEGNETEISLSKLLRENSDELIKTLGNNLYFELVALLGERNGLNLRNKVAHGLIDANDLKSYNSLYFWWFSLRLILMTTLNKDIGSRK